MLLVREELTHVPLHVKCGLGAAHQQETKRARAAGSNICLRASH